MLSMRLTRSLTALKVWNQTTQSSTLQFHRFKSTTAPLPEFSDVTLGVVSENAKRRNEDRDAFHVVSGASRGIGNGLVLKLLQRTKGNVICLSRTPPSDQVLRQYNGRLSFVRMDLCDPQSVVAAADQIKTLSNGRVDMLLNVAGMLGNGTTDAGPERTVRAIDSTWLRDTFALNLFGHVDLTSALYKSGCLRVGSKTKKRPAAIVASLSARVGSISDNGLGGWYSYRMSKSALNQFTKCLALEGARDNCHTVALHPGTVDTDLSVPFQKNVPKLLTTEFSATRLLEVIDTIDSDNSGGFYDFNGKAIPW